VIFLPSSPQLATRHQIQHGLSGARERVSKGSYAKDTLNATDHIYQIDSGSGGNGLLNGGLFVRTTDRAAGVHSNMAAF
jgi:hypothetical protein